MILGERQYHLGLKRSLLDGSGRFVLISGLYRTIQTNDTNTVYLGDYFASTPVGKSYQTYRRTLKILKT
jgi:hypothetical protein